MKMLLLVPYGTKFMGLDKLGLKNQICFCLEWEDSQARIEILKSGLTNGSC